MSHRDVIAFLGGGPVVEALIRGALVHDPNPSDLVLWDASEERRRHASQVLKIRTADSVLGAVAGASVVVLAVDTRDFERVAIGLRGAFPPTTLLIGVVAGTRLDALCATLEHTCVVRAAPNALAYASRAATVWTARDEVSPEQRARTRTLLAGIGTELELHEDEHVDAARALTTPAFALLVVEGLVEAGVNLGFPRADALALVVHTLSGSVELLTKTKEHPAVLRGHVTSPGGATAAGLLVLEHAGVRAALQEAVRATADGHLTSSGRARLETSPTR